VKTAEKNGISIASIRRMIKSPADFFVQSDKSKRMYRMKKSVANPLWKRKISKYIINLYFYERNRGK